MSTVGNETASVFSVNYKKSRLSSFNEQNPLSFKNRQYELSKSFRVS